MHIRPATPNDSPALAKIQITSYRTAYAGIMPAPYLAQFSLAEQTQDWRDLLAAPGNELLYVAELDDGAVVGYALGRIGLIGNGAYASELVALHLLPRHQRGGIGGALFAAIVDAMRARGSASLLLWTLSANPMRGWYERLGGQPVGEQQFEVDGTVITEVGYGWPEVERLAAALA